MDDKEAIKNSILATMPSIKTTKKKGASLDAIYNAINQKENDIEKAIFNEAITELVELNLICAKGKAGNESFSMVIYNDKVTQTDNENIIIDSDNTTQKFNDTAENSNFNDTAEKYKVLVEQLKSEINFLRQDSINKSRIIEQLITSVNKLSANDPNTPKDVKLKHDNQKPISINVETSNTFDALNNLTAVENNGLNNVSDENVFKTVNSKKTNKRTISILTDSMAKDIEPHRMRKSLMNTNDKVYMKCFNGANIEDMGSYVLPTLKHNNDLHIIHVGSNDLRSEKTAEEIATNITNLAKFIKNENNEIIVSGIIVRNDNMEYDKKGKDVNKILTTLCAGNNFGFIKNDNINARHINGSGLHLNNQGTFLFASNLIDEINL